MEKMKEYIIKNKKIVIPVVIIIILLLIGSIYLLVQTNSNSGNLASKQEIKETEKEEKKDLTDYVKNLKDLTVEVNAKKMDFLKDVTYDKKVVKEVTVDPSKVDLTKEGKYTLTYSIVSVDTSISKKTVIKKVTVEVISKAKAQKEADKGKQVITSDNEVKKDSNANTTNNSSTQNTNINSNSSSNNNSGGSSKPNTDNNSGNSSANDTKPVKPAEPKHEHKFVYVPAQTHTEYEIVTHTEEVPVYTTVGWYECNHCHTESTDEMKIATHCEDVCGCGWTYKTKEVQNGTQTVNTEEKVPHEVIDVPAYYKCECGETHQ